MFNPPAARLGGNVHNYSCLCDRFPGLCNDRYWGLGSVSFALFATGTNSAEIFRDDDCYDLWWLWLRRYRTRSARVGRDCARNTAVLKFVIADHKAGVQFLDGPGGVNHDPFAYG